MKELKLTSIKTLLSLLFILMFSACSTDKTGRMWLAPPGWGWAQYIDTAANQNAPIVLDDDGIIYIFTMSDKDEKVQPKITSLNRGLEKIWETTLEISQTRTDDLQFIIDQEVLWLFWRADKALYQAKLDLQGNVISQPISLVSEINVENLEVAKSPTGEISVWYSGRRKRPGLYTFDPNKNNQPHTLIDPDGVRPSIVYDQNGDLHAIWTYYPRGYDTGRIYYAYYPSGVIEPEQKTIIHIFQVKPGHLLIGPWLGVDGENTYVFWLNKILTGFSSGETLTHYIAFPLGQGRIVTPKRLLIPEITELDYQEIDDTILQTGPVVALNEQAASIHIEEISVTSQANEDLIISFQAKTKGRWNIFNKEIGTMLFLNAEPKYYQIVSRSAPNSFAPSITSDGNSDLYMTWFEPAGENDQLIYIATTAQDIHTAMGPPNFSDVSPMVYDALFGISFGLLLSIPFAIFWMIIPLITYGLTSKLRSSNKQRIGKIGSILTIGLILIEFWIIKYNMFVGVDSYVPFSTWIPLIPTSWTLLLQFGVPSLIFLISFLIAWSLSYRRDTEANLAFTFIYIAIDAVLTMGIYGILIYEIG